MAVRTTINISLTPELEKFVQSCVQTGRYQSASEVVCEGLRMLEQRVQGNALAFRVFKSKLKRAAGQADRGELATPDQVRRKIDHLKRERTSGKS